MKLRIIGLLVAIGMVLLVRAQATDMYIFYKDGSRLGVPMAHVDSITFGQQDVTPQLWTDIRGSWLWAGSEQGYYELLTFNADNTYRGYDRYFSYGFDTSNYGFYALMGNLLTLRSYGLGYQRVYRWFVTALADNALEVMTPMGSFTYYRLQSDVIRLKAGGAPFVPAEGDSLLFADGQSARIDGGVLYGLLPSTTYVLLHHMATSRIVAREVLIEN